MLLNNPTNITNYAYTAVEDDVLALLGKAGAIKMDMVPTLIFKEAGEFEKMDTEVARHFLQNPKNYSWGVLQEIRDEMIEEFISNQNRLRDLYLNPLETIEGYNGKLNAKDLVSYIEYLKVRLRRSMSYMLPEFTFTKSTNPSTKTKYELIKAYWIDDDGTRSRSFNKTMGNQGLNMELLNVKMFETLGYIALLDKRVNGVLVDIVLSKGEQQWVVEVKHQVKENYIDAFATIELWKHYKTQYGMQ